MEGERFTGMGSNWILNGEEEEDEREGRLSLEECVKRDTWERNKAAAGLAFLPSESFKGLNWVSMHTYAFTQVQTQPA